ncbi:MAG: helix-turn-helix domain-containing protein [Clostridia bacterium]|nr:helix-turn-helix domain-containing protein [Clostridia bacterium]
MICFAGSGFADYANAKNKADFFSYAKGNFFPLPKRIFNLGLSSGEILVYAYLLFREDRTTFKCHPSYATIGKAVGMSKNTVKKYVDGLEEKRLIETRYTTVQTKDGRVHNGTLEYTILPLNIAEEYYDAKQMKRLVQEQAKANFFKKLAIFDKKRESSKG